MMNKRKDQHLNGNPEITQMGAILLILNIPFQVEYAPRTKKEFYTKAKACFETHNMLPLALFFSGRESRTRVEQDSCLGIRNVSYPH